MGTRVIECVARCIDYRLTILGVRVWENECRLIARRGDTWFAIGPPAALPIVLPRNTEELKARLDDEIYVTASQFLIENPASDIADVLSKRKDFASAIWETGG